MKPIVYVLLCILSLYSCNTDSPGDNNQANDFKATGAAEPLSQEEFDTLTPERQYEVANKLLSMMQKGIPVDEFFDISNGIANLVVKNTNFINNLRTQLRTPLSTAQKGAIDTAILGNAGLGNDGNGKYRFQLNHFYKELAIAKGMEYPVSRDSFAAWIAHFLANTIMFSPAREMDSTDEEDIQFVMSTLEEKIKFGVPVRNIIGQHLASQSRWRVSRSAENHALEAMELYLGIFADTLEAQEDIQKGGQACQEWYLTNESNGYRLEKTGLNNTEQLIILQNYIVIDCNDFNAAIAQHPNLLLRVTSVIVDYLLNGRDGTVRTAVKDSIVDSGATTFEDIFKGVLFSKEFLLNTERPLSYENNFLSMLDRLKGSRVSGTYSRFILNNLIGGSTGSQIHLRNVGWESSEYKIGRPQNVPVDALSFASSHKAMRESLFGSSSSWIGGARRVNDVWLNHIGLIAEAYDNSDSDTIANNSRVRAAIAALSTEEYIDYLFLSTLSRKASTDEKTDLIAYLKDPRGGGTEQSWLTADDSQPRGGLHDEIALAILDYISRLEEFYYIRTISVI